MKLPKFLSGTFLNPNIKQIDALEKDGVENE